MMFTDNTAKKQRGRSFIKGQSGNPHGRPKGIKNKATLAAEVLLEGESERLTRKAIELALSGDTTALRLCLERIIPPCKERKVTIPLPKIKSHSDLPTLTMALLQASSEGVITPGEACTLAGVAQIHTRCLEDIELEERLTQLENKLKDKGKVYGM